MKKFLKNEKNLYAILIIEICALIFLILISAYLLLMQHTGHQKLKTTSQLRYSSYLLADQLRQSSDDLTRMVRSYAASGDSRFEEYFWHILDIRDGKKIRPLNYERIYWDFITTENSNLLFSEGSEGKAVSLKKLMQDAKFTSNEFELLAEAQRRSDKLVSLEQKAIQAMKGEFTTTGNPDRQLALQILFGKEYHEAKKDIMEPINKFFEAIDNRTGQNLIEAENNVEFYNISLSVAFGVLISNGLLLLFTAYLYQKLLTSKLKQKFDQEINMLRGIIPICSYCKKIRNDKGAWDIFEAYICSHSEAEFSHGVCPECYKKQMKDID